MTWTSAKQNRLNYLLDREVNGGGLLLDESRECRALERSHAGKLVADVMLDSEMSWPNKRRAMDDLVKAYAVPHKP